jgi:hypothetical protein
LLERERPKGQKGETKMKTSLSLNHNETLVRDTGKNLKVKTRIRAGEKVGADH